ncbi:MAG: carboxymuconolactone decarboxylase family protein [Gammaproteobacteria bacterium]|nr:carboxymuconolactone decarboxylase family protein [Gammaproteobacteria bacterium]
MARIPLPSPAEFSPEQRRVYDAIIAGPRGAVRGPLRAAIHNPELAEKWQQLGALLRYRTSLSPRLSELAILVTARHFDCQFEWFAHEPPALDAGIDRVTVDAIRRGVLVTNLKPDEEVVFEYSVQLHVKHFVDDATYERTLGALGVVGVVELSALLGYYAMVAMTLNAHEIPLPDGVAPPLPPRRAP